jgi:hypothetical protein
MQKITRRMKQHGDRYRTVCSVPSTNAGNVYITYRTVSQFKTSGFQNYQRMAKQHGEIASERSVLFREANVEIVSRTVLVQNLGRAPPIISQRRRQQRKKHHKKYSSLCESKRCLLSCASRLRQPICSCLL